MQILEVASRARFAEEKMQKIGLVETDRLYFDLYCLRPGQAQKVHRHDGSDKIYYVLSGRASVRIGDEEAELAPGQAVLAPAGTEHGVANRAGEPLSLLVFMAPKPAH
ncbi:MAG TPA: cupin domain-containing protein [Candidatus Methylomirabilis sp.]|nr:cupin domain-containing protein [Candidatus Methylomirabilis sp.]